MKEELQIQIKKMLLRNFDNDAYLWSKAQEEITDIVFQAKNELDTLLEKLPLKHDGEVLQIWREKDNSWDVAYNTDSGNLKPIVWEQGNTLTEAVNKMLDFLRTF